jgi:hypothetical protein
MLSSPRRSGKTTLQRSWMSRRGTLPDDVPPPQCRVCRAPMLCSAYILEVEGGFWEPVFTRSCGCGLPASRWVRKAVDSEKLPLWGWGYVED